MNINDSNNKGNRKCEGEGIDEDISEESNTENEEKSKSEDSENS